MTDERWEVIDTCELVLGLDNCEVRRGLDQAGDIPGHRGDAVRQAVEQAEQAVAVACLQGHVQLGRVVELFDLDRPGPARSRRTHPETRPRIELRCRGMLDLVRCHPHRGKGLAGNRVVLGSTFDGHEVELRVLVEGGEQDRPSTA